MSGGPGQSYPGEAPAISVVVPTWEGAADWLPDALRGLAAQDHPAEVVIVLDGPAPRLEPILRRLVPVSKVVRRKENQGFAVAATAGLRAAKGQLITTLNDDAVPEPGWLSALAAAAARHPNVASFASVIVQAADPGRLDSAGHGLTRWCEPFDIGHGAPIGPPFTDDRPVFGPCAAAAAYRRELLRPCGGFDPGYGAYLEDVDLSLRAQLSGHPCRLVPDARVHHRGSASYGRRRGDGEAERLLFRNRLRLAARGMPRHSWARGAPAFVTQLTAELGAMALRGESVSAALAGLRAGLRELPEALADRPATLGGRRLDDAAIDAVLRESEIHLLETLAAAPSGPLRTVRRALVTNWHNTLDAWRAAPPPWGREG